MIQRGFFNELNFNSYNRILYTSQVKSYDDDLHSCGANATNNYLTTH